MGAGAGILLLEEFDELEEELELELLACEDEPVDAVDPFCAELFWFSDCVSEEELMDFKARSDSENFCTKPLLQF